MDLVLNQKKKKKTKCYYYVPKKKIVRGKHPTLVRYSWKPVHRNFIQTCYRASFVVLYDRDN